MVLEISVWLQKKSIVELHSIPISVANLRNKKWTVEVERVVTSRRYGHYGTGWGRISTKNVVVVVFFQISIVLEK